ncbi:alpha/beta hydrolase [Pseudoclavibacter sp. RFBI5]|uniref:esterase/lipase family protein n=1 Tax=Pseudoclavibacter sp. RFBI5 TaxID=2080578 RepID=UPI000CE745F9|nr:alpha/beta hydrolase [Pseudoclavibacter sp. RFBI5]PPG02272.1 alpha/beta hydrolase [Pseudoclavibacter sp. RFBI5]
MITGALQKLGWWALDYVYAVERQVRAAFSRAEAGSYLSGDGAPVVIIPGVYEPWRFMLPLIEAIHENGHPVHVLEPLGFNHRPVPDAAKHVAAYLRAHDLTDVLLVTHSKGGLVGKFAMSFGDSAERIAGMLAIATPFAGSRYARAMAVSSLRIFSPSDATILALARESDANARIVSVFGRFDPHIPDGSVLELARNIELPTGGHFRILTHPGILRGFAVLKELTGA